jgi:hypothetical protein
MAKKEQKRCSAGTYGRQMTGEILFVQNGTKKTVIFRAAKIEMKSLHK